MKVEYARPHGTAGVTQLMSVGSPDGLGDVPAIPSMLMYLALGYGAAVMLDIPDQKRKWVAGATLLARLALG